MALHTIDPLPILRRQHDLPSKGPTQLSTLSRVFQPFDDMVAELDAQLTRIGYSFNGANLGPARPFIEKHLKGPLSGRHLVMGSAVVATIVAAVFKVNRGALKCLAIGAAGFVVTSAIYERNADKAIVATRFTRFNEALLLDLRTPAALLVLCVAIVSSSRLGFLLSGFAAAQTLMRLRKSAVKAPSEEQLTEQIDLLKSDEDWMQKPLSDRFQSRFLAFVTKNPDKELSKTWNEICGVLPRVTYTPIEAVIKMALHYESTSSEEDDVSDGYYSGDEETLETYLSEEFIHGVNSTIYTEEDAVESHVKNLEKQNLRAASAPTLLEGLLPVTSFKAQSANHSMLIGVVAVIALRSLWCRDMSSTLTAASLSFVYTHIAVDAPGGLFQSMSARLDSQEALMMAGALFITSLFTRGRLSFFVAPTMGYLMGNFAAHLLKHERQLERTPAELPHDLPGLVATIGDMPVEQAITSGALEQLRELHAHMFYTDTYASRVLSHLLDERVSIMTKRGLFANLVAGFRASDLPLPALGARFVGGQALSRAEAAGLIDGLKIQAARLDYPVYNKGLMAPSDYYDDDASPSEYWLNPAINYLEWFMSQPEKTTLSYYELESDPSTFASLGAAVLFEQPDSIPREQRLLLALRALPGLLNGMLTYNGTVSDENVNRFLDIALEGVPTFTKENAKSKENTQMFISLAALLPEPMKTEEEEKTCPLTAFGQTLTSNLTSLKRYYEALNEGSPIRAKCAKLIRRGNLLLRLTKFQLGVIANRRKEEQGEPTAE